MESFYQTLYNLGYTHPVHPTMVYLPIGCVMAAFIFGLTSVFFNRSGLLISAKHCITLAVIAAIPTIIFGYMDWQYFHGGNWIFPIRMKIFLAALLMVLLTITVVFQWKLDASRKSILALFTFCFFNVVALGYYGGEIVFAGFEKHHHASDTSDEEKKTHPNETVTYDEVAGIFHQNCIQCHKGPEAPYDLQLDTYEHVMKGGLEGKVRDGPGCLNNHILFISGLHLHWLCCLYLRQRVKVNLIRGLPVKARMWS